MSIAPQKLTFYQRSVIVAYFSGTTGASSLFRVLNAQTVTFTGVSENRQPHVSCLKAENELSQFEKLSSIKVVQVRPLLSYLK